MIVYELTGSENHPEYVDLENTNLVSQLFFLESLVKAAVRHNREFLSQTIIKALNFHAIACLHINSGEYRPCDVSVGDYLPPRNYRVSASMDDFVNVVNRNWQSANMWTLSAYVLWRINHIHPFINGNGRTARACSCYGICVKSGGLLRGRTTLPQLLMENRSRYVDLLQQADEMSAAQRSTEEILAPLAGLIQELLNQQLSNH